MQYHVRSELARQEEKPEGDQRLQQEREPRDAKSYPEVLDAFRRYSQKRESIAQMPVLAASVKIGLRRCEETVELSLK